MHLQQSFHLTLSEPLPTWVLRGTLGKSQPGHELHVRKRDWREKKEEGNKEVRVSYMCLLFSIFNTSSFTFFFLLFSAAGSVSNVTMYWAACKYCCFTVDMGLQEILILKKNKNQSHKVCAWEQRADFVHEKGIYCFLEMFESPGAAVAWVTLCTMIMSFFQQRIEGYPPHSLLFPPTCE